MAERARPLDAGSRRWALAAAAACLLPLLLQLPAAIAATVAATGVFIAWASWRRPLPGVLRVLLAALLVGLVLVQAGFAFGRDTGCAVLAAMLALKPAETAGVRDARSLLGFALFAPFATFLLDQGPLALALGLVGVLAALAALQRLAELDSRDPQPLHATLRLRAIGRLVGLGLPLALAAFWLFPRLGSPLWGVPERALARPGLSDTMSPGGWLDLMGDDTPAMRVRFFGRTPPREAMYWRGPVLWRYDGRTWTRPDWMLARPRADVGARGAAFEYELEVEPTDRREVPALELLDGGTADGTFLGGDHTLITARPLSALTRWRLRSAPPASFEPELAASTRRAALALPDGFDPRTRALAAQWRAQAGPDDGAIVDRALDMIRRDFAYTLSTPLPGRHAVDEFLFDQREGYCEHFSSSFVVLMRAAGIPARVVTGYTGGYYNRLGDYWVVRRSDAHAWAEVWLAGRGWVRVDPTAAVDPSRIYDTLDDRGPAGDGLLAVRGGPLFDVGDWMRRGWNDLVLGFDAERQERLLSPLGIDRVDGATLGALFALSAVGALLWMLWLSRHDVRETDPVLRAWHQLERRYRRLGLGRAPHEPAGDWVARIARTRPDLAATLQALSADFVRWRYAAPTPGGYAAGDARDLARRLRSHRPRSGDRT